MNSTARSMRTVVTTLVGLAFATLAFAQPADRIWTGGPIITIDDKMPRAEAVAERGAQCA